MTFQFITPYSVRIGIIGAGTMGSGIALAVLLSDMLVTLYDVSPEMLETTRGYIEKNLMRKDKGGNLNNLHLTMDLGELHEADIVIEAIPEDLSLKRELFAQLEKICPPPKILATNTSTLAVTAIAAATETPERVAGMHFFNPAPVLPLVEVVRGADSSSETIQALVRLAEKIGKTPITVQDTPGFVVNRVARPFYGEALRLLGEGAASSEQIDQVLKLGGGFRMGPFELMDLIGIDVNLAAMQSLYSQTHGEPRYRPHPIQVRMVQQNRLGRKTGRGFYDYRSEQAEEKKPPSPVKTSGQIFLSPGSWAPKLGEICRKTGYTQIREISEANHPSVAIVRAGKSEGLLKVFVQIERELPGNIPLLCQCADITLTEIATWAHHPERIVGFDGLFFHQGSVATLIPSPTLNRQTRSGVENWAASLGYFPVWIQDSPALVLPRIICMLANEAAFAVMDRVAEPEKIDLAMRLGVNYPKGPLSWAKEIGYAHVVDVLDHLFAEYHEERYRAAPLLRRWARLERIYA